MMCCSQSSGQLSIKRPAIPASPRGRRLVGRGVAAILVLAAGPLLAHPPAGVRLLASTTLLKAQAHSAAALTPAGVTKYVYGESRQRRPLVAYVLGQGSNVTMIFGGFHGNEQSTPGVVNRLLAYLRKYPEKWTGCRIILAPRANPDGLAADRRTNAAGVDLNRNFPGTWKPRGSARRFSPGPAPASEPETRAIINLVRREHPVKVISIHEPLHLMNWTGQRGRQLAALMRRYNHYRSTGDIGYSTPGSFGSYCGRLGIAIVTLELPRESARAGWDQNREALLTAIRYNFKNTNR